MTSSPATLTPGTRIGRYEVQALDRPMATRRALAPCSATSAARSRCCSSTGPERHVIVVTEERPADGGPGDPQPLFDSLSFR